MSDFFIFAFQKNLPGGHVIAPEISNVKCQGPSKIIYPYDFAGTTAIYLGNQKLKLKREYVSLSHNRI